MRRHKVKVALNYTGGYRNTMTLVLTGLDLPAKAVWAEQQLLDALGGPGAVASLDVQLLRHDHRDAERQADAMAHLVVTAKDADPAHYVSIERFDSPILNPSILVRTSASGDEAAPRVMNSGVKCSTVGCA